TLAGASDALRDQILGLAEDKRGVLWVAGSGHVVRVNRDKLLRGALADGDMREYSTDDGLRSVEGGRRYRSVVTDALGRVWLSMSTGLSVVDPSRLTSSSVPAIVHIQTISADNSFFDLQGAVRIPVPPRRITFGYSGLSLWAPDR